MSWEELDDVLLPEDDDDDEDEDGGKTTWTKAEVYIPRTSKEAVFLIARFLFVGILAIAPSTAPSSRIVIEEIQCY